MTVLQKAILTVEGDPDGDGNLETGEFHMAGNAEITPGIRTGYLVGGAAGNVNAFFGSLLGNGQSRQEGIFLGAGGGTREWEVSFRGWEGSDLRWGDTGNGGTATDATGEDPLTQIDVLLEYLSTADIDSRAPATLAYGQHWSGGRFDEVDVVVEGPRMSRSAEDGSWFDGDFSFLAAADLAEVIDGAVRTPF